jgi:voltage-gated potassium channel
MVTSVPSDSLRPLGDSPVDRRRMRRRILGSVLRVVVVTGTLLVVYATAPIGQRPDGSIAVQLGVALLVLVVVLGWQIHSVTRSPYPTLRGVETVCVSVPLLVLSFAATYFGLAQAHQSSFTESLSRVDGVYFAVTVLATVGFGDIAPTSETARLLVTLQMIVDLVLVGLIAKVLVGAVRHRREALGHPPLH